MNSAQVSDPIEMDVALQRKIELALLSEPNISDYAILIRRADEAVDELIVYYIPQGPVNQTQLQTSLTALLNRTPLAIRFVPLYKLPLTPDGLPDYQALAGIPVLDDLFLDQGEQKLKRLEGVRNAALVSIARPHLEETRYHLSDVLPGESHRHIVTEQQAAASPQAVISAAELPPALVDGGPLTDHDFVKSATLLDLLRNAAADSSGRPVRFVLADGSVTEWRYADLWHHAERIYAGLAAAELKAGDKVVFQMHDNRDILAAFWACQMGGFVPVIVEVPTSYQAGNQALERVIGLLKLLNKPLLVADAAAAAALAKVDALALDQKPRTFLIEQLKASSSAVSSHSAHPDDIAFFNLSSGSTGIPKCIMLTHRNLLSRACGTNQLCGYASTDVILNWLPFDHIGSISDWHVRCVLLGCDLVYVDKDYVLGNPINWLNLIDRFRVTHSWAPNFAFSLINKQLEVLQAPTWDLSCVKGLLTAGEAVSDSSVQGFIRALGKFGLKSIAVQPAFGMAELGSGITYFVPSATQPLRFHTVRKPAMGKLIERVGEEHPAATHFADLGPPIPSVSLRIVDNDNRVLPMETVGRLQISGAVVFQGYFDNPSANAAAFQSDGWFNTGDLGFLTQGNLVLTGREKETIIIKGSNYYSHEIEDTATQVEGVEPSFTAACGVRRVQDREEKLALFFVPNRPEQEAELIRAIRTQIANRYGISPTYLIPLEKHQIPKTAIGKIQRTQLKQRLEAGEFDELIKRADLVLGNANTLPSWFYRSLWTPKQALARAQSQMSGAILILMDGSGLGQDLAERLQTLKQACVTVAPGSRFERKDDAHYEVNPRSKAEFLELFRQVAEKRIAIGGIVSLLDYHAAGRISSGQDQQGNGDYLNVAAFLNMIQAAVETGTTEHLKRIMWIASDSQAVTPDEKGKAQTAMMTGFTNVLRMEYPGIECAHIDLAAADHLHNSQLLVAELGSFSKEPLVAYRHGQRYVLRLEQLDLAHSRQAPVKLEAGGFYLVSGGLGGLGFELCRRLGRDYGAKLLIIGRSPLVAEDPQQPAAPSAENSLWQRYQALLSDNIVCSYVSTDISDLDAVREQVALAETAWNRTLDGIFHLAGIARELSLERESVENFTDMARPKCEGILVMGELIKARKGAFLVAFSSVNATFGGSNTGGYSAANVFMEAYCRHLFRSGLPALCYAWSLWDGLGMSSNNATKHIAAAKGFRPISLEEGLNSLAAVLHSGQAEALIGLDASKNPIRVLIADRHYEHQSAVGFLELDGLVAGESILNATTLQDRFGTAVECRLEVIEAMPLTEDGKVDKNQLMALTSQDRQAKKKPENDVEATLVELWRELLQVTDIGTQDNFFELGGDSLLTVQLAALIAKTFNQQIPASTIFHAPTIEQLAEVLHMEQGTPDYFSLVPIKASGNKPPLFIVQTNCRVLVSFLDAEQPAYSLNYGVGATTVESMLDIPESVEDLAAHYVREIQLFQPQGPYYIIGQSAAGLVAYEMAQQLLAQQEAVGMLGMIDTWYLPNRPKPKKLSLRDKLSMIAKMPLTVSASIFRKRVESLIRKIKRRFQSKESEKILKSEQTLFIRIKHLFPRYLPKPYPGKVSYFKCTKQSHLQPETNDDEKWAELVKGGIRFHYIHCHHDDVLSEPYAKMLAEQITQDLP